MAPSVRSFLTELFAPLAIAAYAAWAVVWLAVIGRVAARDPALAWLVRLELLLFLAGFIVAAVLDRRTSAGHRFWACMLMAGSALALLTHEPSTASPILLVLLAAVLAACYEMPAVVISLLALNLALLVIQTRVWGFPFEAAWINLAGYGSFQAFAALVMRYAARNERLAEELRVLNADLLATRSLLEESTRGEERLKLSRELHDIAGHSLTALKLNLGVLLRDPRQPDPDRLRLCAGLADELLQNLRAVVQQMRAHDGVDLRLALQRIAAPFPRPRVHLDLGDDARVDSVERAEALLRAAQEGLTNAARHAGAHNIWIELKREDTGLMLRLRDDGRVQWPIKPGNGLSGMRERLEALGGRLDLAPAEGGGLQLTAHLPQATPA